MTDFSGRQPGAVLNALALLEEVARVGPGVTAREISVHLGLPKATTYRLVNLLVQHEYLVRTPDLRGFALGHKVELLSSPAEQRLSDARIDQILDDLRARTRGGIHLVDTRTDGTSILRSDGDFPMPPTASDLIRQLSADPAAPYATAIDHPLGTFVVPIRGDSGDAMLGALVMIVPGRRLDDPDALCGVAAPAAHDLRGAFG